MFVLDSKFLRITVSRLRSVSLISDENGSFLQAVSKAITNPTVTITDELKRSRLLHPWSYQSSSLSRSSLEP